MKIPTAKENTIEQNSAERWNMAADNYQRVFKLGMNEYNASLLSFWQERGMIFPGARALDVGCGVGKYGRYLAELGLKVTLTDISPKMLQRAAANMEAYSDCEIIVGDFSKDILNEEKYDKHFDLVLSTMSPAIEGIGSIEKFNRLSKGWCFVANFVSWEAPLRSKLAQSLGLQAKGALNGFGSAEACEQTLQWIKATGKQPEVVTVPYNWSDERTVEEMTEYFLQSYSGEAESSFVSRDAVLRAVRSLAGEDGKVHDNVNTNVAWIFWQP